MRKLNVDRMRKRVSIPKPSDKTDSAEEQVVIRDAVGRVIRVLPAKRGW